MKIMLTAGALALSLSASAGFAQDFGTQGDIDYASRLWAQLEAKGLVGEGAIMSRPYDGTPPHGMMLETFYSTATMGDHTGTVIVKRNYGPEGVEADAILADPGKHLGAVTVMYKREHGYDADNQDWFWVKYLPDGTLDKNAGGMSLAGRVAKGADVGCIACHSGAEDYIFTTDAIGSGM